MVWLARRRRIWIDDDVKVPASFLISHESGNRERCNSPHLFQVGRHEVDKTLNPVKPQPLAFRMEIPVQVMRLGIGNGLDRPLKRLFDGLFVTLLIDEVDEPDFVVNPGLLRQVKPKRGYLGEHAVISKQGQRCLKTRLPSPEHP